jgi:kynureninase
MNPAPSYPSAFQPDEAFARQLDAADPLRSYRDQFAIPQRPDGQPVIYFCGHSLGLQPRAARTLVEQELDDWARLGVEGHFRGRTPWYSYHETLRDTGARLVGGRPSEVVFMNGLTVNLHLLMISLYRPTRERFRILTDEPAFPSDRYALWSQVRYHGHEPRDALLTLQPRAGEHATRAEDIEHVLRRRGSEIALVLLNGVNFYTGQWFDMPRITALAHEYGCVAGFDLAHAAGNVPLQLHDWDVDFAVWCSYKYLNGGPGAVAGCFVHEKHGSNAALPRLAGWWGTDPATRFQLPTPADFVPRPGADGWQLSNPPILSLAPVRASLELFDRAGMPALRAKSECLTGYLLYLLDRLPSRRFEVITPRNPAQRGCQLSLLDHGQPRDLLRALESEGVICDFREPNVIRVAPVPLYNTFHEVWSFAQLLARQMSDQA